ncbi:MAG: nucleotidyl transferase AbiEii/AbiGii toxin family protein [Pseudomonadota bacterium]
MPRLLCYSRESAIAEKFEAMVKLGALNSRMKDFYDIWLLSRQFDFDGAKLAEAIRLTFDRRGTVMLVEIEAFDAVFISAKQIQWSAFWKRLQQDHVPVSFGDIVSAVKTLLVPVQHLKELPSLCAGSLQDLEREYSINFNLIITISVTKIVSKNRDEL